jgi:hypothetical protein
MFEPRFNHLGSSIMRKSLTAMCAAAVCIVASLAGCVSSHVIIGTVRPAISPDAVQVYLRPPANYEEVAILDTSSKHSWTITAQGRTDKVIERLKEQAASLGANGVLLQGIGDQAIGSVGGGFGSATVNGNTGTSVGIGSSATVFTKKANGLAIYIPPGQAMATYH